MMQATADNQNELYYAEQASNLENRPWWDVPSYLTGPIKFGAWDGVFVSIMLNIFGALLFLQGGFIVGVGGVSCALVIVFLLIWIGMAAGAAAIGICERTDVANGGLYKLLSRVLGAKQGAAVGIVFAFGLTVTASLYASAFATAVLGVFEKDKNQWAVTGLAIGALIILLLINLAGVKWVIRSQILFFIIIIAATIDFLVGPAVKNDVQQQEQGFWGFQNSTIISDNMKPEWKIMIKGTNETALKIPGYVNIHEFFGLLGIFFPSICGVFAGVNMAGDLKSPSKDIPKGTIASILVTGILYIIFIIYFGATCTREALVSNQMIGGLISASKLLFNIGIYISSISGVATCTYGAPRLIRSIAEDGSIKGLEYFEVTWGASKVPVRAILLVGLIAIIFLLAGDINTIAPIIANAFLLVYGVTCYANFCLSKAYHERKRREKLQAPAPSGSNNLPSEGMYGQDLRDTTRDFQIMSQNRRGTTLNDHIEDSFAIGSSLPPAVENPSFNADIFVRQADDIDESPDAAIVDNDVLEHSPVEREEIRSQPQSWYKFLCTPTHSLVAAIFNTILMFLVHWVYALINFAILGILVYYIHVTAPGLSPGLAGGFSFLDWLKSKWRGIFSPSKNQEQFLVIAPPSMSAT
ncbi:Oidioi.mRNA.OKI2018_I69.XSR.g14410.t2.cds [Oikopleura dioica]|nr:Oidioi.mRNA.OKI2018_I69.XSR.g14410.t2.cds [Oikopleura dioica]